MQHARALNDGQDAEQLVRAVLPDGTVQHYEGEKGAERLVREVCPSGTVPLHFEGEKGTERFMD